MTSRLPGLYQSFAHLCLGLAGAVLLLAPYAVGGFFYHPRMLALVHLLTLGWVSASLLGAGYRVLPAALRTPFEPRASDFWACVFFTGGSLGIVSHFWIGEWSGVGWSGLLVFLASFEIGVRLLLAVATAPVPRASKVQLGLAFANLLAAAFLGLLAAMDKYVDVLPGHVLANVAAHAHLALLGWGTMAGLGLAVPLLALRRPGAVPAPRVLLALALFLELAIVLLVAAILTGAGLGAAAVLLAAALLAAAWPLLPLSRSRGAGDGGAEIPAAAHLALRQSLAYLLLSCALGLAMAFASQELWLPRAILVYGVSILAGFLGLLVLGIDLLLRSDPCGRAPMIALGAFSLALPVLAAGLAHDWGPALRLAGASLVVAALAPIFGRPRRR